jgi:Holliday junction DNA helicase RuvB
LDTETTPRYLRDFVGQARIKSKIQQAIEASMENGLPPGHIILIGPAGSGKTTLGLLAADNIANATSTTVKAVNGSGIKLAGDLAGLLTNLDEKDLLFVDNVDQLPKEISEYLEPALADFKLDIIIDEGPNARGVRLNLPRFTLISTATNKKRLSPMLQSCFTTDEELEGYSTAELADITRHDAKCLMLEIEQDATDLIVRSTSGTPSSVLNLIRHIRVYAKIKKSSQRITAEIATEALKLLESNERLEDAKQARQGIPSEVRREVWRRDGGRCVKCGNRERLEYDHIIPVIRGGSNTARNIELLCETCNRAKSDLIR